MKSSGSEPGRRRQNVINIKGHQAAFNEQATAVKRFETFIYIFIYLTLVTMSLKDLEDEKYLAY